MTMLLIGIAMMLPVAVWCLWWSWKTFLTCPSDERFQAAVVIWCFVSICLMIWGAP